MAVNTEILFKYFWAKVFLIRIICVDLRYRINIISPLTLKSICRQMLCESVNSVTPPFLLVCLSEKQTLF